MITRQQIVEEAMSWVGTPYHHEALVKGPRGGVDCGMINIGIFRDFAKIIPASFDPRPYAMQWHLNRNEERYLGWVSQYARKVESPELGDVILYKFGRCVSHSAILVAPGMIVHAYRKRGAVVLEEMQVYENRVDSYWSVF